MNRAKYGYSAVVILLVAIFLAACTVAQTQTPAVTNNSIPVTSATGSSPTSTAPSASTAVASTPGGTTSTSGTKYVLVASKSSASYAVREQLAQFNFPTDAVGKTSSISGQIVINADGSIDSASSKFIVDVSTLKTNSSMRDNFVANNILQSNQYPQAIFIPTQINGLPATLPQSGNLSFTVNGNLTIRNATKPVTWNVSGSITNGEATGTATTSFTFEDFSLNQPHVPVVLSVVDKITLTVTLDLQPSSN